MSLKSLFLKYVETQRSAEEWKSVLGTSNDKTISAFEEANSYKRQILDELEKMEKKEDGSNSNSKNLRTESMPFL